MGSPPALAEVASRRRWTAAEATTVVAAGQLRPPHNGAGTPELLATYTNTTGKNNSGFPYYLSIDHEAILWPGDEYTLVQLLR